ncbi:FAD binding domain-containing protein [Colletotrichum kahawae]|uniref:FAD binding domain-containing protein n=1 Tax=Colletotrichum kahawae TaxID=34407 RepID=A0AAD9YF54_COLKA|nr:FAD binding domain-containing protein [Colletotrichum kahawae]
MGSDKPFVPHNGSIGSAGLYVPSRLGGRLHCDWAFYQVPSTRSNGIVGVGTAEKLRYNPHCVRRDLSSWLAISMYTDGAFLNATVRDMAGNIASFQSEIDS